MRNDTLAEISPERAADRTARSWPLPPVAILFLLLTIAVSVIGSRYYLLHGDDLLELWGDLVPSFGRLLHVQRFTPIAIDPFVYHVVTFTELHLFGLRPVLLRLSGLAGFVGMQICLFFFVRRIANQRAAVFGLMFPAITSAFAYTWVLRPYGFPLVFSALMLLSWQTAARRRQNRTLPLAVLAAVIAIEINTHYYAILIIFCLGVAELVRLGQNRRFDLPMMAAFGVGISGAVFLLPFLKGASEFRSHFSGERISYHVVPQSYNSILFGITSATVRTNHLLALLLVISAVLVLWSCFAQARARTLNFPAAEFALLVTLAALPVLGFLLGHFVTNAMEPRYSLGAIIGISALMAIAIAPLLRNTNSGSTVLLLVVLLFVWQGVRTVRSFRQARTRDLALMKLPADVRAAIMASPSQLLYTQDVDAFAFLQFHEPDQSVLSHLALVYSAPEEMRWNHVDASTRVIVHLKEIHPYNILPYEEVVKQPGEHVFLLGKGGWNWLQDAVAAENVSEKPLGPALGLEAVSVRFRPANANGN